MFGFGPPPEANRGREHQRQINRGRQDSNKTENKKDFQHAGARQRRAALSICPATMSFR
jgi:hypothetical protein